MDIHYAESAILTPSDFAFARDGVAADTAPNTETIAIADLSLADLLTSRQSGAVQNLRDRRFDLYRVDWKDPAAPGIGRSEEHTSELQSLMRISYAVFCLKKKKHKRDTTTPTR